MEKSKKKGGQRSENKGGILEKKDGKRGKGTKIDRYRKRRREE